jgi:hypothetical protein
MEWVQSEPIDQDLLVGKAVKILIGFQRRPWPNCVQSDNNLQVI